MRVCLMIEGQEDVTWQQWVTIARTCEDSGIESLFRSDHYLSVTDGTHRASLDAWATLSALAATTDRLRLGTLVSPATFRHPSVVAKMVVTADHISNGRVELGLGAGWHEPEHRAYGFPFPNNSTRLEMLQEQVEIIHRQWTEDTFDFEGRHYRIKGLDALPKPLREPHPNLIVGGSGGRRSIALAARWADEYNTVFASVDQCAGRRAAYERAWKDAGRDPALITFSLMTGCVVGRTPSEFERRARACMERDGRSVSLARWVEERRRDWVIGTVAEAVSTLRYLGDAGVDRIMLQHLVHEDDDMIRLIGEEIAPAVGEAA